MRKFILVILTIYLLFSKDSLKAATMGSYCYIPPSLGQAVQPNVMLLIDVSGSMSWCAYNPYSNKIGCCTNSGGCGWTYTGKEEGYFDPNKVYRWTNSCNTGSYRGGCWIETTGNPSTCPKTQSRINRRLIYSGSCLNFLYNTRIDLVRWALTGGTLASCNTGVNINNPQINRCDPESYGTSGDQTSCDSYGCVLETNSGTSVKVPWSRIYDALLFKLKNLPLKPRMGVMFFSYNGVRNQASVYIGDFTGSNNYDALNPYKNTITHVNAEDPYGVTPTAPALWDTYNYFAQKNPVYGGLSPQSGQGAAYKNPMYQCFDDNNDGQCEGNEFKLVPCAKNFVILLTDGQWNTGGNPTRVTCSIDTGFEQYSADPVVPAYWLHKKGFINQKTNISSYVDAIYGIGLFLGGTGAQSLKNVAMYGSFDRSKQWPDSLSDYPKNSCYMDDCGSGKGSGCTPLPSSSSDWDKNGDGVPDTFFGASNATEIKNSIYNAILDILKRTSSGSTVATLTGRSNTSQLVVQPYFLPKYSQGTQEYSWFGFLKAFWVDVKANFREDSIINKILNMIGSYVDKVFQLFYDPNDNTTKAALVSDTTNCTLDMMKNINQLIPVMDAGCYLANTNPSNRNIYFNQNGTLSSFDTTNSSYFSNIWKVCSNDSTVLCSNNSDCSSGGTCVSVNSSCLIRYIRGEDLSSDPICSTLSYVQRSRTLNIGDFCSAIGSTGNKVWKLGDIIDSSPVVVSNTPLNNYHLKYNDKSYSNYVYSDGYKNRPTYVAIGANDGMLHFFRLGTIKFTGDYQNPVKLTNSVVDDNNNLIGEEVFSFIPKNAIPYLVWYGRQDYCHIPTVDYRLQVFDAKLNGQWRTILVGTLGFGGSKIDTSAGTFSSSIFVLDLTDWLNGNQPTPKLLWEASLPDNSLTTSFPAVVKNQGNWYLIAGTGPQTITTNGETYLSSASVYVFDLYTGNLSKTITVPGLNGVKNVALGDIAAVDINNDYNDEYAYFGAYGTKSNGSLFGALYRLNISSWTISQAFDFGNSAAPVFAAPNFTKDEFGNFWVFFGTGKYLTSNDKSINYNNYIIGFMDDFTTTTKLSDLTDVTNNLTISVTPTFTDKMCTCDPNGCSNKDVVIDAFGSLPVSIPQKGWYIKLTNESVISQSEIFGGVLNLLSLVLPQDLCSMAGSTNLYSLFYKTGTPSPKPSLISPTVVQNNTLSGKVSLGTGTPPLGNPFQITSSGGEQFQSYIQISTGVMLKLQQQTAQGYGGRFILWIEK